MKYLFLFLMFLVGCSTPRSQEPVYQFECVIFGGHGSYAHMIGKFKSKEYAEESAEKLRLYLVGKSKVPNNTTVLCFIKQDNE